MFFFPYQMFFFVSVPLLPSCGGGKEVRTKCFFYPYQMFFLSVPNVLSFRTKCSPQNGPYLIVRKKEILNKSQNGSGFAASSRKESYFLFFRSSGFLSSLLFSFALSEARRAPFRRSRVFLYCRCLKSLYGHSRPLYGDSSL